METNYENQLKHIFDLRIPEKRIFMEIGKNNTKTKR
jgi:hypothetical protein